MVRVWCVCAVCWLFFSDLVCGLGRREVNGACVLDPPLRRGFSAPPLLTVPFFPCLSPVLGSAWVKVSHFHSFSWWWWWVRQDFSRQPHSPDFNSFSSSFKSRHSHSNSSSFSLSEFPTVKTDTSPSLILSSWALQSHRDLPLPNRTRKVTRFSIHTPSSRTKAN